jgi:uncharacterized membrane protein
MAHAEKEVSVNKPVAEVYAFLADGTNNLKWRDGVVSIQLISGEAGKVDAVYAQTLKGPGGRTIPGDYRITIAELNHELDFVVVAGPARPIGSFYFTNEGEVTKVKFTLDLQPKGFMKLMGSMIQKTMDHEVSQLTKLKAVLEASN